MEAGEILQIVKSLSRARRSCTYYQVDLHVHSPASLDYQGDKAISPHQFVSEYVARGFDLIAITDHHTGAFIDDAINASSQIEKDEGKKITILPGVELNVSPGVHLLAILGYGGSEGISDLLSSLQFPVRKQGNDSGRIKLQIEDVVHRVHERGGLVVGAHSNSTHGVINELSGLERQDWLKELDALEINSGQDDRKVSKDINYVTNNLGIRIPYTFGSDSHDATSDTRGMWVKMAKPSFTCLRQFIFEPELRISRTEPNSPTHGRIVGFTATHGIYANERFRFSPNLNVLLGGRGAGKSAAIDLLRFAFDAGPRTDDDNYAMFANRIMSFLQTVGEVLVVVVGADGEIYVITRSGAYDKPRNSAAPTFTKTAQICRVADNILIPLDLRTTDILGIEFYGQGEAARLADRVSEQLRLIDENLDHSIATATIEEAERKLIKNENQVIEHKQAVERLRVEAAARRQLEARRDHLAGSLADPIFAERSRWDYERTWIQERQDYVQATLDLLPESMPSPIDVPIDVEGSPAKNVLEKVRDASERFLVNGLADLDRFRETVVEMVSELEAYRAEWDIEFEIADNRYRARLAEIGAINLDQIATELRGVENDLTLIANIIEPKIKRIETEIAELENRRANLLEKLRTARSTINKSRVGFVEELNSKLGGNVMVSLSGNDASLYFETLNGPLQKSGMHRREEQVSLVCDAFTPEQLVEILRTNSIDKLKAIGITEHSAKLLMQKLTDEALYKIERVEVPPLPSICIKREGETSYTDLASLSVGEKCSAILSIALLSKGKPLVIDQPEDDLDHAFIVNSIVEGIRTAKSDRQIVAATHNPNIPVLGDAEMVFRVARQAGNDICQIQNSGGLELPRITKEVQSLEGGAEAFERRRRRYSGVA